MEKHNCFNRPIQILVGLIFLCVIAGCSPEFWSVVDVLTADPVVHSGTVERVELSDDQTTIHFQDGISYTVKGHRYVAPGKEAKITRTDAGLDIE